jgi:hypothetical protein
MGRDYFDPVPEEQVVVLVESATVYRAEKLIKSCEHLQSRRRADSV